MVKVKNKKRNLCEAVKSKNDSKNKKTLNPFEVHINKEKLKVLGRKLKNDRGLPGVARAKAQKKRKHTLLPEYEVQNKSNKFMDKRIGERNGALSAEDKSMARYTAVRVRQHNRKSIFNLADDEVLTHKGQTLSEIEKFDDPRSDDDDEDDDGLDGGKKTGNLQSDFVGDAHFGGGMLKKADGIKSHKDLIEQLIAESKKRKAEKQKQKEATVELTEKLDTEWKDLLPLVSKSKKEKDDEGVKKPQVDDYDKVMRELKFEARGTPSDKLKSEDELAREEKEKLERLEQERLDRMRGVVNDDITIKHRSADDLDDNFEYEWDAPDITLSYNDEAVSNIQLINGSKNTDNTEKDDDNDEEDEESGSETEDNLSDLKESDDNESEDEIINDEDEFSDGVVKTQDQIKTDKPEDSDDEGSDSYDDNKDNQEIVDMVENVVTTNKRKNDNDEESNVKKLKDTKDVEKIKQDLLERKAMMEEARKELPYTYTLPETYKNLQEILQNQPPQHHGVIIERIIKCNHPSLKEGNKDSLGFLFIYLLQYLSDISEDAKNEDSMKNCFIIFSYLVPQFFDLAQINPKNTHTSMLEVIKEKQSDFRDARTKFPKVDVLLYLKLLSTLFSTSDFRHSVVIPSIVFIEQMLTTCKVRTRRDVAYGLFLVSLIMEYTTLSKRYLPAAMKFLSGVIHMAVPKCGVKLLKVLPPFKHTSAALALNEAAKKVGNLKLSITDLVPNKDYDESFKLQAINVTLGLLQRSYNNYESLSSCPEIFEIPISYLKKLPVQHYPSSIAEQIRKFMKSLDEYNGNRKLDFLVMAKKKPKALRLYEPNIVKVFDGKQHKVKSKEKMQRDKLLHKLKREKKGALREIRRDKAFLGRVKIDKRIQSDLERKEKVKRIYSEASVQQSELNTMDRKNAIKKKK